MFWKKGAKTEEKPKAKVVKLPGPAAVPDIVAKYLVDSKKRKPQWVSDLKAVVRDKSGEGKEFDIRVFETGLALAKKITVQDYTSLNEHPDLIYYEGWFDKASKKVELEEKPGLQFSESIIIFTEAEIKQKIEALSQPGSSVFFYLAGSAASGGPLGRGAAVVELNPNPPDKKQKKYILHVDDVDGMEPVGKRRKVFDSNELKEIASWVKERHHKAWY